jgi:transcriptional regulator GlxA family with amidase domain
MHTICLLIYPRFQSISLAVGTVFEYANRLSGKQVYDFHVASEHGGPISSSLNFSINTVPLSAVIYDTLIVSGDNDCNLPPASLLEIIRRAGTSTSRIASICTGSFVLAETGLLDGKHVTTYWAHAPAFRARYPHVLLDDDRIYVVDGQIWTSAGMTAGLDLALAMVENDLGMEIARLVARHIVVYHRRGGAQSQFSVLLELDARSDRIQKALAYAKENLNSDLSVEALAHVANMSPRQFSRIFSEETGRPPGKAIERLRVEAARFMLETSAHPIGVIAKETGFGDRERMRQAFLRAFGQAPQAIKKLSGGSIVA